MTRAWGLIAVVSMLAALLSAGRPAAAAAPCAGANDRLPSTHDAGVARLPAVRHAIACLVNRERRARGLRGWKHDTRLGNAAQRRANDLVERGYFAHRGPDGRSASDELHATGYAFAKVGEDLVSGFDTAAEAERAWLTSLAHCAIMLDPGFKQLGVGVAFGRPLQASERRPLVLYAVMLAARPKGVRQGHGPQSPREGCPYLSMTETAKGWDFEPLTPEESAKIRCHALSVAGLAQRLGLPVGDCRRRV